jgi:HTH-type transcriptional regulator/antitoxin HigA
MIKNDKEYRSTKAALTSYEVALRGFDVLKSIESGVDPVIARAQRASYERQAAELREKVSTYEALRDGTAKDIDASEITQLGRAIIEARVARGLTQRELANLAGLQEQQIQRYEKELYGAANLRRIAHIANCLGVQFEAKLTLAANNSAHDGGLPGGLNVADFPIAEMNLRRWFGTGTDLRRSAPAEKLRALSDFFAGAPKEMQFALHRKSAGSSSPAKSAALLAWQARILMKARQKTGLARRFTTPPPEIITRIAKLSAERDGIEQAIELLLDYGIIVVFERHLPKTRLDGAAMSLDAGYAVIGMSARHDRIDNFWFVLLHELGHIIRHWRRVLEGGILDEEAGEDCEELIELEANEFAENAILPKTTWLASAVRFTKSPDGVREFANRHGLHPALIAGRIRRERSYTEFPDMLGNGEVRSALRAAGLME